MRSLLFVPGDTPRKLDKAAGAGADVLLIDLEDSVAPADKVAARDTVADFIKSNRDASVGPRLFVRINAFDTGLSDGDLRAVVGAAPDGIMLPKCQSGRDATDLDNRLSVLEAQSGIEAGRTEMIVIATETAAALFEMGSYRDASPRLSGLTWGAEDLSADIGALGNRDAGGAFTEPFRLARSLCLFAANAAQTTPIDTVYTAYRDLGGLRAEAEAAVYDGFTAKMAIHPAQVAVINEVFTPTPEAVERARRIVTAFEDAGDAGVLGIDGEMVDRPHLRRAGKLLERARLAGVA